MDNNKKASCDACFHCDLKAMGRKIRQLRLRYELRQVDAAAFFRVSVNTWSQWEKGKVMPTPENLYSLACVFDVPVDELLVGNRDEFEPPWKGRGDGRVA